MLPPKRDPISVRTARLNNLILGKGQGVPQKSGNSGGASVRRSVLPVSTVSASVAEAICREGLLDAFCLLYNECDKDQLKKRDRNISEFVNKFRPIVEETRQLRVNIDDFIVKTLIGKGYFGNVHLVIERETSDVYAMKKVKKSVVTTSQVKEERDIMARRQSEWLINLQYAFQDNDHLYLVMEYMPGGDLLSLMSRHGPFDEDLARFYLAELTLALHALHSMGYVHRDIKPENILIDRLGHIKLADFGNAAELDRDGHVLSLSPVGTPDYIAPELLQTISTYKLSKSMHDVSCDYWSMGIIGYELMCDITPFHDDNVHDTYSKILSHCEESHLKELITFPSDLKVSANYKNLIESLVTNPSKRLTYNQLVKHPFFDHIQWNTLRSQVPPIMPTIKSDDDTSNFEDGGSRHKGRRDQKAVASKKSLTTNMKSHDFSGKDLPFIGYSFVHMEKQTSASSASPNHDAKLQEKLKDLQQKLKLRETEIAMLKKDLQRAQQSLKQTDTKSPVLVEAKMEIKKLQQIIKEKTIELAHCNTQIKTLQSSAKIDEEMWSKKEATITDLLRLNRQKYEEAKIASEQRYEKQLTEKKQELASCLQKMEGRELEFNAKNDECKHLSDKLKNYIEMLKQMKEQNLQAEIKQDKQRTQLTENYEKKLDELNQKLRQSKDTHRRTTLELQDVRNQLNDTVSSSKSTQEAKQATQRNLEELLKRLDREIAANNELHSANAQLNAELKSKDKEMQEQQTECQRLERELQLAECRCHIAESSLASQTASPYETAPGSLTELHTIGDQLRADLEAAKEAESQQKVRADKLQTLVTKLEEQLEHFNEQSNLLVAKRTPPDAVGDMLERQNEKLEDKLATVREQMIVERQAARTANLSLWKVEKQLEETLSQNKLLTRRMELTEDRVKKAQTERDEAQRVLKFSHEETRQRESRIDELKEELAASKRDVMKEHRLWEKAEQERIKSKSEIIEHLAKIHSLEQQATDLRQKLQQANSRIDSLTLDQKRLQRELKEEHDRSASLGAESTALRKEVKQLTENFQRLKYACSITDNQITELESLLTSEQARNKTQKTQLDACHCKLRERDNQLTQLREELAAMESDKRLIEQRSKLVTTALEDMELTLADVQKKMINQQSQLVEQTNALYTAEERISQLDADNTNYQSELSDYKKDNTRILSELFHRKEEIGNLQAEIKDLQSTQSDLNAEIDELQDMLTEKEQFYVQRDIKATATLAQHKKLIDYLQLQVEDLSAKKKKTLADKIFGSHTSKENISPNDVESCILYRTLKEELRREQKMNKTLKEQLEQVDGQAALRSQRKLTHDENEDQQVKQRPVSIAVLPHSPRKQHQQGSPVKRATSQVELRSSSTKVHIHSERKSPKKITEKKEPAATNQLPETGHHRFELALQESKLDALNCIVCDQPMIAGSSFWRCRECKDVCHRKCRSSVTSSCGSETQKATAPPADAMSLTSTEVDLNSLDTMDNNREVGGGGGCGSVADYLGTLVYNGNEQMKSESPDIEVNCLFEVVEQKILLLGCNNGLYAYHMSNQRLIHIAGIVSVAHISISTRLAKAIMVDTAGEKLYQCDYRQLESRCQSFNACHKPALETAVIELPFANRTASEKWKLVEISNESENPLDSVAIAATSTRIVILKYDSKLHKFKPVRALDTATPVTSIFFTRHSAIVSSDKFYEIDLDNYGAEEFVDLADKSMQHTSNCQPFVAVRISKQEYLLCFSECGVFVDEFGCRSRPYDLNWVYAPTGFVYREPFLYVAHYQCVQIIRLHRSYSKEVATNGNSSESSESPDLHRVYLPHHMSTLLGNSGEVNLYAMATDQHHHPDKAGRQKIYLLDSLLAFKKKLNVSMETISSVATSVTLGSCLTTDSS
ncbi:LOW QUALITY PROTEIN: citron Rho-interacting kinase [Drosophila tropicalis]|uniref:LOW QUALITY PROTEIN: citron Rho-interacting kinase n=1 Tax=Drosophila tropicalis TaxID=46794 RepID=UPI0035AC0395